MDDGKSCRDDDDRRRTLSFTAALDLAAADARRRARARLRSKISALLRAINKPLDAIIAEHALPFLSPQTLRRLRCVSSSWNRHVSSPIFAHTHSYTPRSPSALFLPGPTFHPFDPTSGSIPCPSLSFLPRSETTVLSSSHGLVCFDATPLNCLIICNPSTQQWTPLPPAHIGPDAVLVFDPSARNTGSDYFVAWAFQIASIPGVYGFHVFSSESGEWRMSNEICVLEKIVAGSGISARGAACWRTTMQTVAIYDPAADRARAVPWPAGHDRHALWEVAEIAGRLCCVVMDDCHLSVYELGDGDRWGPRRDYLSSVATGPGTEVWRWTGEEEEGEFGAGHEEVCKGTPVPMRFQSGNLDVVVAAGEEVYVLDLMARRVKHVSWGSMDAVVYMGTLAPVYPQPKV